MEHQEQQPDQQQPGKTDDAGARAVRRAENSEAKLTHQEEVSALDYLLGAPGPPAYTVEVEFETDKGMAPLTFHFVGLDGRVIDKIEQANINDRTAIMDKTTADAELVIRACSKLTDATGKELVVNSEQFRVLKPGEPPLASPVDALFARFGTQAGLISGVATAIREAAGWDRDRVGKATRVLVDSAGN